MFRKKSKSKKKISYAQAAFKLFLLFKLLKKRTIINITKRIRVSKVRLKSELSISKPFDGRALVKWISKPYENTKDVDSRACDAEALIPLRFPIELLYVNEFCGFK